MQRVGRPRETREGRPKENARLALLWPLPCVVSVILCFGTHCLPACRKHLPWPRPRPVLPPGLRSSRATGVGSLSFQSFPSYSPRPHPFPLPPFPIPYLHSPSSCRCRSSRSWPLLLSCSADNGGPDPSPQPPNSPSPAPSPRVC